MRQLILSPRWIVWHLLTLGAMITCGLLAAWQWQRAGSAMGSALNVGYGLQWPVFAVFFGVMWWRMLRMEAAKLQEATPSAQDLDTAQDSPAEGHTEESRTEESHIAGGGTAVPAPRTAEPRSATAPSPFGPRPRSAAPPSAASDDDPELADYNRMLAQLAARHSED